MVDARVTIIRRNRKHTGRVPHSERNIEHTGHRVRRWGSPGPCRQDRLARTG